jgi:hypothetical protein
MEGVPHAEAEFENVEEEHPDKADDKDMLTVLETVGHSEEETEFDCIEDTLGDIEDEVVKECVGLTVLLGV